MRSTLRSNQHRVESRSTTSSRLRSSKLETLTLLHLAVLGTFSAWAFGGSSAATRTTICIIGSLAPAITVASLIRRRESGRANLKFLLLLLPWFGFNLLVLLGTLQPSFRVTTIEGGQVFIPVKDLWVWPSSARPELARQELWLLNAIVLSAFNLLVTVYHRRTLRNLFYILGINALILAVFGSIQKFASSPGIFFGQVASPNSTFFATFIYHNHWGAYMVLMLAICLGLLFSLRPWAGYRDFWHSPALAAVVVIFFLSVTIPLSGSRSCTAISVVLLAAALIHGLQRIIRHHQMQNRSAFTPSLFMVVTAVISLGLIYLLARPSIETRLTDTQNQITEMRSWGNMGSRGQLYRDTLNMAQQKLVFGWGLGSYGTVFRSYNTQKSTDNLPQYYEHAHSDWLQLLAETGLTGVACYLCFLALPLFALWWRVETFSTLPRYILGGCALIMLYAWVEFPFGNPAVTLLFWICFFGSIKWIKLYQPNTTA